MRLSKVIVVEGVKSCGKSGVLKALIKLLNQQSMMAQSVIVVDPPKSVGPKAKNDMKAVFDLGAGRRTAVFTAGDTGPIILDGFQYANQYNCDCLVIACQINNSKPTYAQKKLANAICQATKTVIPLELQRCYPRGKKGRKYIDASALISIWINL